VATGDTAGAAAELEECRRLRPELPGPLVGLAGCAIEVEDPDRALELFDRAVELDPSSIGALSSRGWFSINQRRDDLALVDFERVVALNPTHKQGHLHLAQIYRRAGDARRAIEHERAYHELARDQAGVTGIGPGVR
jgi:tetratricopeptide (TPR) repeat protein